MAEEDPLRRIIDDAFENEVVTHYILVAEVMTPQGQEIKMVVSDEITPWLAVGLLTCAEAALMSGDD